jgi:branched-chain amino acid transport system substrate-binding protein
MRLPKIGSMLRLTVLVGAILIAATACGESSSDSSAPEETTSSESSTPDSTEEAAPTTGAIETAPEDSGSSPQSGPIKIGILNPTTGNFTVFGEKSNAGIQLYFDGVDNTLAGRDVELVFADTAGDPQQALEQARRLVDKEEVDAIIGLVNSAAALAISDFADQNEVPLVIAVGSAASITLPGNASQWVSRVSVASGQEEGPLGWYAASVLGYESAATMAWDFISGNERAAVFADTFTGAGGEITSEQRPPPNATEYGPFLAALETDSTDSMYTFVVGPGSVAFFQQMEEFGISGNIVPLGSGFVTAGILDVLGDTALGLIQSSQYTPSFDSPANAAFIEAYSETTGQEAGVYSSQGYLAAETIALAIDSLGGDTTDPAATAGAVRSLSFESHAGPISFDDNGQAIRDLYITRIVESGDGVVQEMLDTIEAVNQGWTPPS